MAEIKTKVTKASVTAFINGIASIEKQKEAKELRALFEDVTGEKAVLWGTAMVGFGSYHYESTRSSQKGDWPLTAFSPRAQNFTVYIMPGFTAYSDLMKKLGKYKTTVSCLQFKRLGDINTVVLRKLIARSVADMKKKYPH